MIASNDAPDVEEGAQLAKPILSRIEYLAVSEEESKFPFVGHDFTTPPVNSRAKSDKPTALTPSVCVIPR